PGPWRWTEGRRAGADHGASVALAGGAPRLQSFRVVQTRVHHGDRQREARLKARDELRRECDLGHEHERLLFAREHLRDEPQVDLGLAAAGYAIQQVRRERSERAPDTLDRLLLGSGQRRT